MHRNGHNCQSISVWKSPPNIDRSPPNNDGERLTLLKDNQSKHCSTFLDIKQWAESHTNTCLLWILILLGIVLAFLSLINTTFGIFGRWTMTVKFTDGRWLAVIFIKKYFDPWFGFWESEVLLYIEIETVHKNRHHLKMYMKNINILIIFRFEMIT